MKVKVSNLVAFFYSAIIFIYSLVLLPLLVNGDQEAYRNFYYNCFYSENTKQQFLCYASTVGTQEPVYFYLVKFFHIFLEKDLFISLVNSLTTFVFVKIVYTYFEKKRNVHLFIILMLFNYYTTVLFFSAERLKFALFFLLLSIFFSKFKSLFFKIIMVLTHIQMMIIYLSLLLNDFFKKNEKSMIFKISTFVILSLALLVIYSTLQEHITRKFISYNSEIENNINRIIGVFKASIFLVLTYLSVKKIYPLLLQFPLIIAIFIFGSSRIIIMVFFMYVATVVYYNKKIDFLVISVLIYFLFRSVDFWNNVIDYGSGFAF